MYKILLLTLSLIVAASSSEVKLASNRYEGIVLAINPDIKEDPNLIEEIKSIWTEASQVLWKATKQRAYFGDITILVPRTWNYNSYNNAENETYDEADILIAAENPIYGDRPYTVQYGECGTPGEYIHLTTNYTFSSKVIKDYGPKGKVMVHEWAHLRWGVFDENPTEGYDPFYFNPKQDIEATRCPLGLKGKSVKIENGEETTCQASAQSRWLPEEGCIFIPNEVQDKTLEASLMSHQYRDEIVTFCHDDSDDPTNLHNNLAPNEHNRLCNQRSVWDVILSSDDFKNNKNMPNPSISDVTPTFNIVQAQNTRLVLVLDTSGSMGSGTRFEDMIIAANMLIQDFSGSGIEVGIVQFSSSAYVNCHMTPTETEIDRNTLVDSLPTAPNGGTCIGCGIRTAISVLKRGGKAAAGGHIIVLTDGEESPGYSPTVKEVHNEAVNEKVLVDSIYFGNTANNDLQALTEATNGLMMANTLDNLLQLQETFKTLTNTKDGDVYSKKMQIHGEVFKMTSGDYASGKVLLDSTIGKETIFSFTWSQYDYAPNVIITDPKGVTFCSSTSPKCSNTDLSVDTKHKTVKYSPSGIAMTGEWQYEIRTTSHSQTINVMVTTMAADKNVPPIVVQSSISATDVGGGDGLVINAKVTVEYKPILGAVVEAKVTNTKTAEVITLTLYDAGAAPDVRRNDGVYSGYFTQYTTDGRYSVQVVVTGLGNESFPFSSSYGSPASFNYGYVDSDGNVVLNPSVADLPSTNGQTGTTVQNLDPFKRIETAGAFSYSGPPTSSDLFPPSKVINLVVKQHDSLDFTKGVELVFTAPGDDLDQGKAESYEIRYTYDTPSILSKSFTSANPVTNDKLIFGDLSYPSAASTTELFIFNITDLPEDLDLITVAFALRATDEAGNTAEVSNIAMMNLFLAPPPIACSDKKGNPISTEPFEKPNDCANFYQCSNGELHTIPCKNNTVFNVDTGVCDYPNKVPACADQVGTDTSDMDKSNSYTTTPPFSTQSQSPDLGLVTPSCKDENDNPQTTHPFPKPGDCGKFYQCSNGELYEMLCPPGLAFNPTKSYCDWPHNVPGC